MAIKEEPVVLNFKYEEEGSPESSCDIQFHTDNGTSVITIVMLNGDAISLPVDLLVETVDFLKQKGVVKKSAISQKEHNNPFSSEPVNTNNGLPVPQIIKKDGSIISPSTIKIEAEPITSFSLSAVDVIRQAEEITKNAVPIEVQSTDLPPEVFKRSVIKSRIRDDSDPLGAERDAAMLRGTGSGKSVRRAGE